MDAFFNNIFTFPTVIFTAGLLVLAVYWVFAVFGLVDLDLLDLDFDPDLDLEGLTGLAGLLVTLGLTGVPLTVVLTLLFLVGWLISYFVVHFFFFWEPGSWINYLVGCGVLVVAGALAIPLTAQLIKPLKPLFKKAYTPPPQKVLIGQRCVVRSSRVDEQFGEATAVLDGASLILKIRASAEAKLTKGSPVVLIEYRAAENAYWVVPEFEFQQ